MKIVVGYIQWINYRISYSVCSNLPQCYSNAIIVMSTTRMTVATVDRCSRYPEPYLTHQLKLSTMKVGWGTSGRRRAVIVRGTTRRIARKHHDGIGNQVTNLVGPSQMNPLICNWESSAGVTWWLETLPTDTSIISLRPAIKQGKAHWLTDFMYRHSATLT